MSVITFILESFDFDKNPFKGMKRFSDFRISRLHASLRSPDPGVLVTPTYNAKDWTHNRFRAIYCQLHNYFRKRCEAKNIPFLASCETLRDFQKDTYCSKGIILVERGCTAVLPDNRISGLTDEKIFFLNRRKTRFNITISDAYLSWPWCLLS